MVRSTTTAEVEWDDQQRGWMLALALWEERRCQGCGGDLTETTRPEHDGLGPDRWRYAALLPVRCHRCTALSASEERHKDAPHRHALIHRVELQPPRIPHT